MDYAIPRKETTFLLPPINSRGLRESLPNLRGGNIINQLLKKGSILDILYTLNSLEPHELNSTLDSSSFCNLSLYV